MKEWRLIGLFAAIVMSMAGCTHNGGDTGVWGGTWHLVEISVEGNADKGYTGNVFWKFQADVIDMVETDDEMHERKDHFGTWSASDDERVLTLDFGHGSDRFPAGSEDYVPPKVTGLHGGVIRLDVECLTGRDMVVKTDATSDGAMRRFVLKKQ